MRYVGVDLHKRSFTVCYLRGREREVKRFQVSRAGIGAFKKTLRQSDKVAVEATGNAGYFAREIKGLVKRVITINPMQFKVISQSVKKTDENDAEIIARYLSKELLPEVRMKSKEDAQLTSLLNTRDRFVKLRTALKNKVHNILNANGIRSRREMLSSKKGLEKVLEMGIDEGSLFEVRIIVKEIQNLNEAIEEIEKEIKGRVKKVKGYENLKSITGIGDITAAILLNAIGDIKDFRDEKKLAAYIGIVPRVHVSSDRSRYGRITKMGNKLARTALVQSTWVTIRYNSYLRAFYNKLKSKKGSGKAIIATARKLLTIIYRTLKNDWVFENFNEFKLVGA